MATGWPRNQQDLRWPDSEEDTSPGRTSRGEAASFDGGFGSDHPSGPLPVSPAVQPQQRGRIGRGKSRNAGRGSGPVPEADADYDWIRYLGEAGPAQEAQKPPPAAREDRDLTADVTGNAGPDSGRGAGRLRPRRHAAPADTTTGEGASGSATWPGAVGRRRSMAATPPVPAVPSAPVSNPPWARTEAEPASRPVPPPPADARSYGHRPREVQPDGRRSRHGLPGDARPGDLRPSAPQPGSGWPTAAQPGPMQPGPVQQGPVQPAPVQPRAGPVARARPSRRSASAGIGATQLGDSARRREQYRTV